jgi:hypothetical protein
MEILDIKPGPKIGNILNALMEEVLEDPKLNTEEYLVQRVGELNLLSEEELKSIADKGKNKLKSQEEEELSHIRQKYKVK